MKYIQVEHIGKVEESGDRFVNVVTAIQRDDMRWQKPDGTYDVIETGGYTINGTNLTVYDKDDVEAYIKLLTKVGEAFDSGEAVEEP